MTASSATATSTGLADTAPGKTEQTREKLLEAGIYLFSQQGYDGTSTRQIEARAEVQRNLMTYHFGSKEEFWKACVAQLYGRMRSILGPAIVQSKDIEPGERVRFLIRRYVRASAEVPEIARIMFDEGRCNGWRLKWLVENYSGAFFETVSTLFADGRKRHVVPDIPLTHFYYLLVGSASMFSMTAECELLTGQNATDEAMVDAHAETMARLLTITD